MATAIAGGPWAQAPRGEGLPSGAQPMSCPLKASGPLSSDPPAPRSCSALCYGDVGDPDPGGRHGGSCQGERSGPLVQSLSPCPLSPLHTAGAFWGSRAPSPGALQKVEISENEPLGPGQPPRPTHLPPPSTLDLADLTVRCPGGK